VLATVKRANQDTSYRGLDSPPVVKYKDCNGRTIKAETCAHHACDRVLAGLSINRQNGVMTSCGRGKSPGIGALASDPPVWRFAFSILHGSAAPYWITLWLVLILGALVGLGAVVGPWAPGAITTIGALTAGGTTILRGRSKDNAHTGKQTPDTAATKEVVV